MPANFLNLIDIEPTDLTSILLESKRLKASRLGMFNGQKDKETPLSDFIVALIFEKPSTRTRFSFDSGIRQMGGQTIITSASEIHLGKNENISDTARVLDKYVDLVVMRTFDQKNLYEFAANSSIPVINGLTNQSHPCQVLADILTFEENRGTITGKNVIWAGDGNNVCNSYLEAAGKFGFNFCFFGPRDHLPDRKAIEYAERCGSKIVITTDPTEAFKNADLVVTDTWLSMHESEEISKIESFKSFQVNAKKIAFAKEDTIVLHCLPAHRGYEITDEVIDGEKSRVFQAAENRLHVQKAIIKWALMI